MRRSLGQRPELAGQEKTVRVGGEVSFTRLEAVGDVATLLIYTADGQIDATATNIDTPLWVRVTAGTGGASFVAEVDAEQGTAITVPAGTVAVSAHYDRDPDAPGLALADTPDVQVGLVLYESPRPGTVRPTRTVRSATLADGATRIVLVPKFGATVAVLLNSPAQYGVNLVLDFLRAPAGRGRGELFVASEAEKRIPNGTRAIGLTNRTGVPIVPTFVFGLHL